MALMKGPFSVYANFLSMVVLFGLKSCHGQLGTTPCNFIVHTYHHISLQPGCAFNQLTLPGGATVTGTNCDVTGTVAINDSCTFSKLNHNCHTVSCSEGAGDTPVWSTLQPDCVGVPGEDGDDRSSLTNPIN